MYGIYNINIMVRTLEVEAALFVYFVTCKPLVIVKVWFVCLFVCLTVHSAIKAYQVTVQYILNLSGQLQGLAMKPPPPHQNTH